MKKTLPIHRLCFNVPLLSAALNLEDFQIIESFKDGRVSSRFSEYWAGSLYGFEKCVNSNKPKYDGNVVHPLVENMELNVSVRSLTDKVVFQQSKYIGGGRKCNLDDLKSSVMHIDFVIVVDIFPFPTITFLPIKSKTLLDAIDEGKLGVGGKTRNTFYKMFFNCHPQDIKIDKLTSINTRKGFKKYIEIEKATAIPQIKPHHYF